MKKLDGVAPLMTDPPPISSTTLSRKKNKLQQSWRMMLHENVKEFPVKVVISISMYP